MTGFSSRTTPWWDEYQELAQRNRFDVALWRRGWPRPPSITPRFASLATIWRRIHVG